MTKKLPHALCSPDKFGAYLATSGCALFLLVAIRQQNYSLVFLTQQRNHCRCFRKIWRKSRRFEHLFSNKKRRFLSVFYNEIFCDQPSASGGVTQPYFSCVLTKFLNVSSANCRLYSLFGFGTLATCACRN